MSPSSPPSSARLGSGSLEGKRVGRYRIFRALASGGMATVYLGWQDSDGGVTLPVAAKVMHPHSEDDHRLVPMMLSEARIASRIRHPNVVSLTDVVSSERGPVLILEYVAGDSLSHLLELSGHTVPWPIVSRILVDALEGLHAAHEATNESGMPLCVVHRDVSPQNILVDEAGHAKIADFGVAKALERAYATQSGEVRGKLAYMAPEQLGGKPIDRRADVWGMGMVLWQMLAGRKPFEGLDAGPTMVRIAAGAIEPPSSMRACPAALMQVCMHALAPSPDERYATARLMALDLERAESPASHRDVARWLKRTAGSFLGARGALVAEMEALAMRNAKQKRKPPPVADDDQGPPATQPMPPRAPGVPLGAPAAPVPAASGAIAPLAAYASTPAPVLDAHALTTRRLGSALQPPVPRRRFPWVAVAAVLAILVVGGGTAVALRSMGATGWGTTGEAATVSPQRGSAASEPVATSSPVDGRLGPPLATLDPPPKDVPAAPRRFVAAPGGTGSTAPTAVPTASASTPHLTPSAADTLGRGQRN